MKRILGLDLGTTSIGWAFVNEAENESEDSSIIKTGVRVVPLSTDEQNDFKKGNSITINSDRTDKRSARRNKFRYHLRRKDLKNLLKEIGFIEDESILTENDKNTTHETYTLRAKAAQEEIEKEEFARVLLMINKKRGYKSSRKANNAEEGELIDGMEIAKKLNDKNLTPGQFSLDLLQKGKKALPNYYRSDLQNEFNTIWKFQNQFYPEIFINVHYEKLLSQNKKATADYFKKTLQIERAELKGKRDEKKFQTLELRSNGILEKLSLANIAYVLTELNNEINKSSGYLSEISDRSKELYFNNQTVGQYQYEQLKKDKHQSLKNQVFYRQDYDDEFETIWKEQSKHYPELTDNLKERIKENVIFYQRKLKSQKGLISYCEFESWQQNVRIDGAEKFKTIGQRVVPKSSPLFQQFKIWQNINSLRIENIKSGEIKTLEEETKKELFKELNWVEKWTSVEFFKWMKLANKEWKINFPHLEGNRTNSSLLKIYKKILKLEGYDDIDFKKWNAEKIISSVRECFKTIGITPKIMSFLPTLQGTAFAQQEAYQLWHLLYSYEDDYSKTGTKSLIKKLKENFGFKEEHASLLAHITFQEDYGKLSARAIRKIYPHLEDGLEYSEACKMAGYNHSSSLTTDQNNERKLAEKLEVLKKNSLRNPVVEKILNQMINVVNAILEDENLGRPDEIRIELARELKKTTDQRSKMTTDIARATRDHEEYRKIINKQFGLKYVSRNDLIRYKLYKELESNGHKTIYSNTYIKPEELFSKKFDIEHIIPKARLFDDSFSNKTLETRTDNIEKADETALDYVQRKYGNEELENYKIRIETLFKAGKINYTKRKKLLMRMEDIPDDFLARDLGTTAYIAKKSASILAEITRKVTLTSGSITGRLREDWGLVKVLQELNWDKYDKVGLTYFQENKHGKKLKRIKDWTKRNDHRHHAMDAITVAFTKPAHIQYLNNLNSRGNNKNIYALEQKYTYKTEKGKRKFVAPFEEIRPKTKEHLESILVSHKAKNKVTTKNKNKINVKGKNKFKYQTVETPRGQLHKETIYGKSKFYNTKEEKVGSKFDQEKICQVGNKKYRNALLDRLNEFENDPKKAFTGKNSLTKNPIYFNNTQETIPEKVKLVWLEDQFTIRKEINADNFKNEKSLEKIVDHGVRRILKQRLKEFNNKPKEAFSNLSENPIWLNKDKGIQLKKATITGVSNAEPLHEAQNHLGEDIFDNQGGKIPVDYVSTGNNHHIAIFKNEKDELDDEAVTFYAAVARKNQKISIINKISENGWPLIFTLKQSEMFIFPSEEFNPLEVDLKDPKNKSIISKNLFRVQKISKVTYGNTAIRDYVFRHHLETQLKDEKELKDITWKSLKSLGYCESVIKVRLDHLGDIVQIGEY